MNITELIEVANKVFMNREVIAKREAERRLKKKATLLASSLKETDTAKMEDPNHQKGETQSLLSKGPMCILQREGTLEE